MTSTFSSTFAMLLFFVTLRTCYSNAVQESGRLLEFTPERGEITVNVGVFPASEEFAFFSTLVNKCKEELRLEHAKTSCGCTSVKLSDNVVSHDEALTIQFRLTSDKAGDFRTKVTIGVKDSGEPIRLNVVGRAVARFEISPAVICLSKDNPVALAEIKANFGDTLEGADCKEVGDLLKVTEVLEVDRTRLAIKITYSNSEDGFWLGANSGAGSLQLFLKDKSKRNVSLFIDSSVSSTVFPKLLKMSSNQLPRLIVFRRSGSNASKYIRIINEGKEIANGTLMVDSNGSKLSRYELAVSPDSSDASVVSCLATVEESSDEQIWHKIGFVTCVFQ